MTLSPRLGDKLRLEPAFGSQISPKSPMNSKSFTRMNVLPYVLTMCFIVFNKLSSPSFTNVTLGNSPSCVSAGLPAITALPILLAHLVTLPEHLATIGSSGMTTLLWNIILLLSWKFLVTQRIAIQIFPLAVSNSFDNLSIFFSSKDINWYLIVGWG